VKTAEKTRQTNFFKNIAPGRTKIFLKILVPDQNFSDRDEWWLEKSNFTTKATKEKKKLVITMYVSVFG